MLNKYKAKREEGFTIIEVLIVLAIAGLIMVIVFIAVPQLQRNQRNEARNNDARLITNSVNECLSNRNGQPSACQALGNNAVSVPNNLREVTTANYAAAPGGSTTTATWTFGYTCDITGNPTTTGATPRQFVVSYEVEGGNGPTPRCIAG